MCVCVCVCVYLCVCVLHTSQPLVTTSKVLSAVLLHSKEHFAVHVHLSIAQCFALIPIIEQCGPHVHTVQRLLLAHAWHRQYTYNYDLTLCNCLAI